MNEQPAYPSPAERAEQEAERLRNQILDTVEAIVEEAGPAKLSVREVARRISYAPASLYHYFSNKNEMIAAAISRGGARIGERIRAAASKHQQPMAALRAGCETYVRYAASNPALARLVYLVERPGRQMMKPGESDRNANLAFIATHLRAAVAAGEAAVEDVDRSARCLWAAAQGLVIRLVLDQPPTNREQDRIIKTYLDILMNGIRRANTEEHHR